MEKLKENALIKTETDAGAVQKVDGRKKNGLYRGTDDAKAAVIGSIIEAGMNNLRLGLSRPPAHANDIEEIRRRTEEYVQKRIQEKHLPTVEGWAVALGVPRKRIYEWMQQSRNKELTLYLQQVREAFSDMHETAALGNCINPVAWIFISKNHFDYADKNEITISPKSVDPLGEEVPAEVLQQKYLDAIVRDDPPCDGDK